MTTIGSGDVHIKLGDEELVLKPTWIAAQTLSREFGGVLSGVERLLKVDMDAITKVITVGLGYVGSRKPPSDLSKRIWEAGVTADSGGLVGHCVTYLRVLANGGRPVPGIDDLDDVSLGEDPENPQTS